MLSVDPADCQPSEIYKLMTGIIVPRPVALVSTVSREGAANLAPFSFFCGVGAVPPTVLFCPALRGDPSPEADPRKDTLRNVEETGEFVINVVSEAIAEAANISAAEVAPEVDEFRALRAHAGCERGCPSAARRRVAGPDGVQAPPGHLHRPRSSAAASLCSARVVRFHLRADLVENFRVDPAGLDAVGRMAGNTWVRTRDRIELIRPK